MPEYRALYRLSNNHVLKVAKKRNEQLQAFADRDTTLFGIVDDPILPDGHFCRNVDVLPPGPITEFGYAKIYVAGSNVVRNATQPEIDAWAAPELEDEKEQDARRGKELLKNHPQWRKVMKLIFKAINRTRSDAGLTEWSNAQIISFIDNNLSKDD